MVIEDAAPLAVPSVSRETSEALAEYMALLRKWSPIINLVSRNDLEHLEKRHIEDSLQLAAFFPKDTVNWIDIGSGGGLPGIVLAIAARSIAPQLQFQLIESDNRKATFLRTAARTFDLNVKVHTGRVEDIDPLKASVISARALGSLDMLLSYANRHLVQNGQCVFLKGQSHETEISNAKRNWTFNVRRYVSCTDDAARVLLISDLQHA